MSQYQIGFYPTLYKICPNKKIYYTGQISTSSWVNWITTCDLDATATIDNGSCSGGGGSIDQNVTGGIGTATYNWSNGATTQDLVNVSEGNYSCTITEGQGHSIEVGPYEVTGGGISNFNVNVNSVIDAQCAGQNSGIIDISVSGGSGIYFYNWSNGETSEDLIGIPAGSYSCLVLDSEGCDQIINATVGEPAPLVLNAITSNENCDQSDGTMDLIVSGGSQGYIYNIGNGPTSNTLFIGLDAGTYMATVTDINGCTAETVEVLTNIPGPIIDAGSSSILDCNTPTSQLNGIISIAGNNVTVNWSTTNGNITNGASGLSPIVDAPGTYVLTVADNNTGCISHDFVEVFGDVTTPSIDFAPTNSITCDNVTSTLSAAISGGSDFNLVWTDASGTVIQSGTGTSTSVTVNTAGAYALRATNIDSGCETEEVILLDSNTNIPIADAGSNEIINCNIASVTIGGSSSTGPSIDYTWLNASNETVGTNETISVSESGTYTLVVTDADNGCSAESEIDVIENIIYPTADAGDGQTLDCIVAEVTLGGNSSSGAEFDFEWTNDNNDVIGSNSTVDVYNAGVYTLEVSNSNNGCVSTSSVVVSENISLPTADAGNSEVLDCYSSTVIIGGNSSSGSNISYSWQDATGAEVGTEEDLEVSSPGDYVLIVTDTGNGCSSEDEVEVLVDTTLPLVYAGSGGQIDCINAEVTLNGNGSSSGNIYEYRWENENETVISTNLSTEVSTAGIYTLYVVNTDNGCEATETVEVIASSDFPTATASASGQIDCSTSFVTLSSSGSSTGNEFTYSWIDEDGDSISSGSSVTVSNEGTFTLVVNNSDNGCEASTNVIVATNIEIPDVIIAEAGQLGCSTTSVELDGSATIGNALSFTWSDAQGIEISNAATATVTASGIYTLEAVNGDNGCIAAEIVEVTEVPDLVSSVSSTAVSCNGHSDGTATATATGGTTPYSYLWSNGVTSATVVGLASGDHTAEITDGNGCVESVIVSISEPTALNININVTNETGDGLNDGSAMPFAAGGSGGYTYAWSTGSNDGSVNNLPPGAYQLTVTDANGCATVESFNISSFDCNLSAISVVNHVSCFGNNDGSIDLQMQQGELAEVVWSPNVGDGLIVSGLSSGTYSYTISDVNNCKIEGIVNITEPLELVASLNNIVNIDCGGGTASGQATVNATGGSGELSYLWSNGEIGAAAIQLPAGANVVQVTDANGCEVVLTLNITSDDTVAPVAVGQNVNLSLNADGLVGLFTGQVNNGSSDNCGIADLQLSKTSFDCSDLGTQTVTLTVTDVSGNTDETIVEVTVTDDLAPSFSTTQNIETNSCTAIAYATPIASDNCGLANVTLVEGLPSGSIFPEGTTTISYEATDESGNTSLTSFTISVTFDLETSANSTDVLCANEANGTAQVFPTGGTPGYQFAWSNGQATATSNNLAPGDYTVVVTDNTGCTSMSSVTIADVPEVVFTLDQLTNASNGQDNGSIDISVSGGIAPYTYSWTLNGTFFSNEEDLIDLAPGGYAIQVQDANGCELEQFGLDIENTVGIENSIYREFINLSPNPTRDQINLDIQLPNSNALRIEILSLNGALVESIEFGKVQEVQRAVSLEQYANGVYLFKFIFEEDVFVEKVILQK